MDLSPPQKNSHAKLAICKNSRYSPLSAGLAQLVERFVYTEDVGSSSLSSRTIAV